MSNNPGRAPIGDEENLLAVGRERAVLVWRHLVLDLTDCTPVRRALLQFASCRYWLRRLASEAGTGSALDGPVLADNDPVWPLWYRLAEEIQMAEQSET
jgi:hypothetical protein